VPGRIITSERIESGVATIAVLFEEESVTVVVDDKTNTSPVRAPASTNDGVVVAKIFARILSLSDTTGVLDALKLTTASLDTTGAVDAEILTVASLDIAGVVDAMIFA